MLRNDRFKRSSLAERRGKLGANGVEVLLGFVFGRAFRVKRLTQVCNFSRQAAGALRDAFKFDGNLPALSAEGFRLRRSGRNLGAKTLLFASYACEALLRLRELIAEIRSSADCFEN